MIKKIIRKIILKEKYSSESYVNYLRKRGANIGERVTFFYPTKTIVDVQYPWMLNIGNDVQITKGVVILNHGYDWSVTKKIYGHLMGNSGPVTIGNNVFIGVNSIILPGVEIGNNVVIGAGSVVSKSIPDNSVAVGNPCKVIYDIDQYYHRLQNKQVAQAKMLAKKYFEKYKQIPDKEIFYDYFYLFEDRKNFSEDNMPKKWKYEMELGNNFIECLSAFSKIPPKFKSYEEFIEYALYE